MKVVAIYLSTTCPRTMLSIGWPISDRSKWRRRQPKDNGTPDNRTASKLEVLSVGLAPFHSLYLASHRSAQAAAGKAGVTETQVAMPSALVDVTVVVRGCC